MGSIDRKVQPCRCGSTGMRSASVAKSMSATSEDGGEGRSRDTRKQAGCYYDEHLVDLDGPVAMP